MNTPLALSFIILKSAENLTFHSLSHFAWRIGFFWPLSLIRWLMLFPRSREEFLMQHRISLRSFICIIFGPCLFIVLHGQASRDKQQVKIGGLWIYPWATLLTRTRRTFSRLAHNADVKALFSFCVDLSRRPKDDDFFFSVSVQFGNLLLLLSPSLPCFPEVESCIRHTQKWSTVPESRASLSTLPFWES